MDTTANPYENTTPETEAVQVVGKSLKIPAWLAIELDREVAAAGQSFNGYVQNILVNRNQSPTLADERVEELEKVLEAKDKEIAEISQELREQAEMIIRLNHQLTVLKDSFDDTKPLKSANDEIDEDENKALRQIISDYSFFSKQDIQILIYEIANS